MNDLAEIQENTYNKSLLYYVHDEIAFVFHNLLTA